MESHLFVKVRPWGFPWAMASRHDTLQGSLCFALWLARRGPRSENWDDPFSGSSHSRISIEDMYSIHKRKKLFILILFILLVLFIRAIIITHLHVHVGVYNTINANMQNSEAVLQTHLHNLWYANFNILSLQGSLQ